MSWTTYDLGAPVDEPPDHALPDITVRIPRWAYAAAERLRLRFLDGELPQRLRRVIDEELARGRRLGLGVVIGVALINLERRLERGRDPQPTDDKE